MKKHLLAALALGCCLLFRAPAVQAAQPAQMQALPGQEVWQPYLDAAPQSAQSFARDPLDALLRFLPASPVRMFTGLAQSYADVLLFLLLVIVLSFLAGDSADGALLELAAAAGCGTLLWSDLAALAQQICEKMQNWKDYLLGFLPVYSGVLAAGGEVNAGAAASGLLLTGLCLLAQCTALLQSCWQQGVDVLHLQAWAALRSGSGASFDPTKNACPQLRTDVHFMLY